MPIDITKLTLEEIIELKRQLDKIHVGNPKIGRPLDADKHAYYEAFDWTKTNQELCVEHNLSDATISVWRQRLGKPKVTKWSAKSRTWDWTKSDTAIARENKVDISLVKLWRKKLGLPPGPLDYERRPKVEIQQLWKDRETWDWTKTDVQLAQENNITRERVRQIRAKLGMPKRLNHDVKYEQFMERFGKAKQLSSDDKPPDMPIQTFVRYCAKAGIKRVYSAKLKRGKKPTYPVKLINWDLPTNLLAQIWKTKPQTLYIYRYRYSLPPAKFRTHKGIYHTKWGSLVYEERRKAEGYFKQQAAESAATVKSAQPAVVSGKKSA